MKPGPKTRVKQVAKLAKTRATDLAQIEAIEEEIRAQKTTTLEEEREHQKLWQQERSTKMRQDNEKNQNFATANDDDYFLDEKTLRKINRIATKIMLWVTKELAQSVFLTSR
jgi:demethoxyubiquinone hydroxylase (CLK1/Coq7/Cat5 family)